MGVIHRVHEICYVLSSSIDGEAGKFLIYKVMSFETPFIAIRRSIHAKIVSLDIDSVEYSDVPGS